MEKGTCFSYLDLFLFVCVLLILCTSLTIMMMIVKLLEKIFME